MVIDFIIYYLFIVIDYEFYLLINNIFINNIIIIIKLVNKISNNNKIR